MWICDDSFVNLRVVLLDQVDVRLRDHAGQGGFQGLPAYPVHRAPVQGFHQSPGAGLALGQRLTTSL